MKIVLTGGGTGGHLFPLIAVKDRLQQKDFQIEFLFIGPKGKLEEELMKKEGIETSYILAGKMRRYFSLLNFIDCFKVLIGFFQSLYKLLIFMPEVVFSKGGFASFPVVLAAWLYRIPVLIHESDSRPGLANTILSKLATRVAVSYPEAIKNFQESKAILTGNPLREDIAQGKAEKAREFLGIKDDKKTILIYEGSQGSKIINEKVLAILPELLRECYVIHQVGEANLEEVKTRAAQAGIKIGRDNYFPLGFIKNELKDFFALADLVISRAGANSISEIAANGKPCILIPLANAANDHQRMNAYALANQEACFVLEESNLGENIFLTRIREIFSNDARREKFSQNIKSFYHADAAEKIANGILELVK